LDLAASPTYSTSDSGATIVVAGARVEAVSDEAESFSGCSFTVGSCGVATLCSLTFRLSSWSVRMNTRFSSSSTCLAYSAFWPSAIRYFG